MHAIKIRVITFEGESPLPYVPAFAEWTDHYAKCVQCAHVNQLAMIHPPQSEEEMDHLYGLLCEGGQQLQRTVDEWIKEQHKISLMN